MRVRVGGRPGTCARLLRRTSGVHGEHGRARAAAGRPRGTNARAHTGSRALARGGGRAVCSLGSESRRRARKGSDPSRSGRGSVAIRKKNQESKNQESKNQRIKNGDPGLQSSPVPQQQRTVWNPRASRTLRYVRVDGRAWASGGTTRIDESPTVGEHVCAHLAAGWPGARARARAPRGWAGGGARCARGARQRAKLQV